MTLDRSHAPITSKSWNDFREQIVCFTSCLSVSILSCCFPFLLSVHIKHYSLPSTSRSVVFPIPPGVIGLVAHVADGSTKSETILARHLLTSGDRPLDAVIMDERRDGPRWLCDDDDDDVLVYSAVLCVYICLSAFLLMIW